MPEHMLATQDKIFGTTQFAAKVVTQGSMLDPPRLCKGGAVGEGCLPRCCVNSGLMEGIAAHVVCLSIYLAVDARR